MVRRTFAQAAQPERRLIPVARSARTLGAAAALSMALAPACVVPLSERNAALDNGGVSGAPADCNVAKPLPIGGPGAAPVTRLVGRYDMTDPAKPRFDWSGNSMSARFEGTEVSWGAEARYEIVFEQILDGQAKQVVRGGAAKGIVTETLPPGTHEITVVRSSEALSGQSNFLPFRFGAGTKQLPPIEHPRRMEIIGDSITCGYGDEGTNASCPYDVPIRRETDPTTGQLKEVKIPETENVYLAYGSLAARRLSADATTLCFSGKGVYQNYREACMGEGVCAPGEVPNDPDSTTTVPQYFLRTLATERLDKGGALWDFSLEADADKPQVVVINLGTNDFLRDADQDGNADGVDLGIFRDAYKAFVQFVRSKRPAADIFLAVPPMITEKFPFDNARTDFRNVLRAVTEELNAVGDAKVYSMELVEMGVRYGLGCDYHPNLEVHRIMADQLVGAIVSKTCWSTVAAP